MMNAEEQDEENSDETLFVLTSQFVFFDKFYFGFNPQMRQLPKAQQICMEINSKASLENFLTKASQQTTQMRCDRMSRLQMSCEDGEAPEAQVEALEKLKVQCFVLHSAKFLLVKSIIQKFQMLKLTTTGAGFNEITYAES